MEINTIIGIVVAIIIMLIGLRMILKKPNHAEPSLDSDLHINPESNQPVIPRHVRDQLEQPEVTVASAVVAERVEPTLSEPAQSEEKGTKELEQASQAQTVQTQVPVENTPIEVEEVKAEENTVSPTVSENSSVELVDTVSAEPEATSSSEPKLQKCNRKLSRIKLKSKYRNC